MRQVELRELLTIEIHVRRPVDLGGGRRYIAFEGGTFAGRDGLDGRVLEDSGGRTRWTPTSTTSGRTCG